MRVDVLHAVRLTPTVALVGLGVACGTDGLILPPEDPPDPLYTDVTATHLPIVSITGRTMDVATGDVDGDGDLDLVLATEGGANLVLINDGTGHFDDQSPTRLPSPVRDTEDVALADLDDDGDLDLIAVNEDDLINELYLNDGAGNFTDASDRLPVEGRSNAVAVGDIDGDGDLDVVIGNFGQNVVLLNDGNAQFTDATATRLPALDDATQDLEFGDVDGDLDLDLVVGNEDRNRLLINDGTGIFADETDTRLEATDETEETREADFGDVDGDGDLDLLFANVDFGGIVGLRTNRLLINQGAGVFFDETVLRIPLDQFNSVDGDFIDVDCDGDLDIVLANLAGGSYQVWVNAGPGVFDNLTERFMPLTVIGNGTDVEALDADGDGDVDLYLANFGNADFLLLKGS